jgi:hypothetical protein
MELAQKIELILMRASASDIEILLKEATDACQVVDADNEKQMKAVIVLLTPFLYEVIFKKLTPIQKAALEGAIKELEARAGSLERYLPSADETQ